jgi:hypothetical protein
MKALLFTLLLLLVAISPSLTAPTQLKTRQTVIYTFFTTCGVLSIDIIWSVPDKKLVHALHKHQEFEDRGHGITRVKIDERKRTRWVLDDPPSSSNVYVRTTFDFSSAGMYPGGDLPYGSSVIDSSTITLSQVTFTVSSNGQKSERGPVRLTPMTINLVMRTVLIAGDWKLDRWSERSIRNVGMAGYLEHRQGGASSSREPPQLPDLSPGLWVHILSDRMSEYNRNDIACEPRDANTDCGSSCRPDAKRPRDPEDPEDDPAAAKRRPCLPDLNYCPVPDLNNNPNVPDLNETPEEQCVAGEDIQTYGRPKVVFDTPTIPELDDHNPLSWFVPELDANSADQGWFFWFADVYIKPRPKPPQKKGKMFCYETLWGTTIHDDYP